MDGPRDYHTKWNRSDREKLCHIKSFVETKNTIQINLFTKQKQTHRHRKQIYGYQRGKGEGKKEKLGVCD